MNFPKGSREARERRTFQTPDHILSAAFELCKEYDRHYPYVIEFHKEADGSHTPFSLWTLTKSNSPHYGEMVGVETWDIDFIERDERYCFHMSGAGGSMVQTVSGVYWRHPDMPPCTREETARYCDPTFKARNKTRRLKKLPFDLEGYEDLYHYLENCASNSDTYYCAVCEEYLPDDDPCEHVWWCDMDGWWRGPGSESPEPCDDVDCWPCSKKRGDSDD